MISEDVRRFAEDPAAWGTIDPSTGLRRVLTDRFCLLLGVVPHFTTVCRLRLDPDGVAAAIGEVRALVAEHGHRDAVWWVGSSSAPADLLDRLVAHGLEPDERPGSEPHATSMVLTEAPPPGPHDVVARRVTSLAEYRIANAITAQAFGSADADAWDEIAEDRWLAEQRGDAPRTYLAFVDDEPVGTARALFADCPAVLMLGGGVLAGARGRGVYRALVAARWQDAVAAGTSALCTQAGAMSRPVLARLGFTAIAEQELLLDPATC